MLSRKHSLKILNNMEQQSVIPSNNSQQALMASVDDSDNCQTNSEALKVARSRITKKEWCTVIILCFVNLINYMDRFTIAGILTDILEHFGIANDRGGLLQTVFVLSYMVFAPLFGYLGDRYSRRMIMAFGVFLWSLTTLLGSFMNNYYAFLAFRALVGVGEASYSTIAPTIIGDLFVKDLRSKMLAMFYFAIPVGSGLGYIVGSETAKAMGEWQWALRVTPVLGGIATLLILFVLIDPVRGSLEGSHLSHTSLLTDIKHLCKNPTFMLTTAGFTCVAFVTGALAFWGPTFIRNGLVLQYGEKNVSLNDVSYKFGIITMVSGILGVPAGSFIAQYLRPRYLFRADPIICAIGLLGSVPLLFLAMVVADSSSFFCYSSVFFAELLLNLNWSIVADMLLYVVIPTRRSIAEAFQILVSHAFGDAGSPYLVGVISEYVKAMLMAGAGTTFLISKTESSNSSVVAETKDWNAEFHSLQYALFITCFVEVLGGCFFLFSAFYVVRDKMRAERAVLSVQIELKAKVQNGGTTKLDENEPTHIYADDTSSGENSAKINPGLETSA